MSNRKVPGRLSRNAERATIVLVLLLLTPALLVSIAMVTFEVMRMVPR